MKLFSVCFFLALLSNHVLANNDFDIAGNWVFVSIGKDYKDSKTCSFLEDGNFSCTVESIGWSDGFGDAHAHKESGKWKSEGNKVSLNYFLSYDPNSLICADFTVSKLSAENLILVSEFGQEEHWRRVKHDH